MILSFPGSFIRKRITTIKDIVKLNIRILCTVKPRITVLGNWFFAINYTFSRNTSKLSTLSIIGTIFCWLSSISFKLTIIRFRKKRSLRRTFYFCNYCWIITIPRNNLACLWINLCHDFTLIHASRSINNLFWRCTINQSFSTILQVHLYFGRSNGFCHWYTILINRYSISSNWFFRKRCPKAISCCFIPFLVDKSISKGPSAFDRLLGSRSQSFVKELRITIVGGTQELP